MGQKNDIPPHLSSERAKGEIIGDTRGDTKGAIARVVYNIPKSQLIYKKQS